MSSANIKKSKNLLPSKHSFFGDKNSDRYRIQSVRGHHAIKLDPILCVNEYTFISSGFTVDNPTDPFKDNLQGLWHLRFKMPQEYIRVTMSTHRGLWLPQ